MKEKDFIEIIKTTLKSPYIGDDCAYLKNIGIVVTQDSLVEDVHFSMKYTTAYQLGFKSVAVNISDVCASGAKPAYLTISLSLPNHISSDFIKQFYEGAKSASMGAKIIGGDITGSNKIFISITAIGNARNRNISSRSNAKVGQKIIISGLHGSSAVGLKILQGTNFQKLNSLEKNYFTNTHLLPKVQMEFSKKVSKSQKTPYAMMDTSDGLADALFAITSAGNVMMNIDFEKIPHAAALEKIPNYENLILYGGEDYGLVATVDNPEDFIVIGAVTQGSGVKINYTDKSEILQKKDIEKNIYNHFKE